MQRLARTLKKLGTPSILVVGDMILDRYIEGDASRVSPEAPVLVFEKRGQRHLLGGACNVAANLVAFGARTTVAGVIGEDVHGMQLRELLQELSVDESAIIVDESRPTTLKTRYVSRTSQVLRVDVERRHTLDAAVKEQLIGTLSQRPFPHDAVLLSDYGKGVLDRDIVVASIAAAHSAGGIVVVDPKGTEYSKYHGVDLLTPNREEAAAATGVQIKGPGDLREVARRLRELTGVETVTVTLGKDGIFFETADGESRTIPTEARSVFDVTGAGDTVVAVLTVARAGGAEIADCLRLANLAAGIVVGRFGTWAVSRQEIVAMLGDGVPGKVLQLPEAVSIAARLRAEGRRIAFTNGCFDILHPGHTEYLTRARSYADALMVGVNTDDSIRRLFKGADRPINRLEDRLAVLAALQDVDYLVAFDDETPRALIEAITPNVLVKGEDWAEKGVVGREWVEAHGGQVVLVPLRPGCSTTAIIERIRSSK